MLLLVAFQVAVSDVRLPIVKRPPPLTVPLVVTPSSEPYPFAPTFVVPPVRLAAATPDTTDGAAPPARWGVPRAPWWLLPLVPLAFLVGDRSDRDGRDRAEEPLPSSPVPEPRALWLVAGGLAGLAVAGRREKS